MVERSHTAGFLPQMYEPLRKIGEKVADWFAPKADAALGADCYEIRLELPGVSADDIDVSVQDGNLTIQGKKSFDREEAGWTYFFSEREYGASNAPLACRPTLRPADTGMAQGAARQR